VRLLPVGDRAVLVEVDDTAQVLAVHHALRGLANEPGSGIVELVPAARTVLVEYEPDRADVAGLRALLAATPLTAPVAAATEQVEIPVHYDGPDLAMVAAHLGLGADAFVAWHTAAPWQVAFTGFAPGFGYLVRADHAATVPRLAAPRVRVPAGSVALADAYTGVYPRPTPGGWQVVGTTDHVLFDLDREPAAVLAPGAAVRFVAR
jgi:KipI family sensor histidine kinase inhibitor